MAYQIYSTEIQCPYCWETIEVQVDDCGEDQQYIEDCQVCCRPINFKIYSDGTEQPDVQVFTDDE